MLIQLAVSSVALLALVSVTFIYEGILTALFVLLSLSLLLLIFLQKGKGSMGLGAIGGAAQTLFGGSGGQNTFQKTTWVMLTLFMGGSLYVSIKKSRESKHRAPMHLNPNSNMPID